MKNIRNRFCFVASVLYVLDSVTNCNRCFKHCSNRN